MAIFPKTWFLEFFGVKTSKFRKTEIAIFIPCYYVYYPSFVWIFLKNSIFDEFSNIYLLSAQSRVKWRHNIRPITNKFRPILIFVTWEDVKLMLGEICEVSCQYSKRRRSFQGKPRGSDPTPRRWRVKIIRPLGGDKATWRGRFFWIAWTNRCWFEVL